MTIPFAKKNGERGFTLIELLVVIAIIGILSSVVLASLNTARTKSRDARRMSDMRQIQTAVELYYSDHGHYPITSNWASFASTAYVNTPISSPNASNLTTALAPYIAPVSDPSRNDNDTGYLYISNVDNGASYCILAYRSPEDLRSYGSMVNKNRCPSPNSAGQCNNGAEPNSAYLGTGYYAAGC